MAQEKLVLADQSIDELLAQRSGLENEYVQLKFEHAVKGLPNPLELRTVRRNIARINTELRSRELAAMSPEELEMRSKIRARRRRQK